MKFEDLPIFEDETLHAMSAIDFSLHMQDFIAKAEILTSGAEDGLINLSYEDLAKIQDYMAKLNREKDNRIKKLRAQKRKRICVNVLGIALLLFSCYCVYFLFAKADNWGQIVLFVLTGLIATFVGTSIVDFERE